MCSTICSSADEDMFSSPFSRPSMFPFPDMEIDDFLSIRPPLFSFGFSFPPQIRGQDDQVPKGKGGGGDLPMQPPHLIPRGTYNTDGEMIPDGKKEQSSDKKWWSRFRHKGSDDGSTTERSYDEYKGKSHKV